LNRDIPVTVNPYEVAREFAEEFARFEYALKRSGYILVKAKDARADWVKFATALGDAFFEEIRLGNVAPTILTDPPRKLMQDGLRWMPEKPPLITNAVDLLEKGVCRIRNSYLHGEKFTGGPDSEQWARDTLLVSEALAVLRSARGRIRAVSALL
jgi:hypothetical protein